MNLFELVPFRRFLDRFKYFKELILHNISKIWEVLAVVCSSDLVTHKIFSFVFTKSLFERFSVSSFFNIEKSSGRKARLFPERSNIFRVGDKINNFSKLQSDNLLKARLSSSKLSYNGISIILISVSGSLLLGLDTWRSVILLKLKLSLFQSCKPAKFIHWYFIIIL